MKRLFDLFVSLSLLIILFPVIAIVALIIRVKLGSPVFFRQPRPGLSGKVFEMVKFRTMSNIINADGDVLPDLDRLTSFGKFLRSTSLDELPELWNVLKGDMSLVGPRPLLMEYLPLYSTEQAHRHDVRPGITGWAQVNGRNTLSWDDKFKLDVWYVGNRSFWLDLKILFFTVRKVVMRDGVSHSGHVSMEKFIGSSIMGEKTDRFDGWEYPIIEDGKPTKYNWVVQNLDGLEMGCKTDIGAFTYINAKYGVLIEDEVQIGSHCSIYSVSTIDNTSGKVMLRKNCKIGTHSTVLPGITIGKNSIIGAHSLVNQDIPDNVIAFGVPAKIVKNIDNAE